MARPPRLAFAGATYHITARGNNGEDIFTDDYDRYAYLALLARAIRSMTVRLFAYTLMTTHVHLILQTASAKFPAHSTGCTVRMPNRSTGGTGAAAISLRDDSGANLSKTTSTCSRQHAIHT